MRSHSSEGTARAGDPGDAGRDREPLAGARAIDRDHDVKNGLTVGANGNNDRGLIDLQGKRAVDFLLGDATWRAMLPSLRALNPYARCPCPRVSRKIAQRMTRSIGRDQAPRKDSD